MQRVHKGQPLKIAAADWNAMADAAEAYQRSRANQTAGSNGSSLPAGLVLVRNDSGAGRARHEVLGIDAPLFTPTDNLDQFKSRVALKGVSPNATTHAGRFVVLYEPIRSTEIGLAWASTVCPVQISVTDASHQYADVATGDMAKLASGTSGAAHILWKETGTGTKWAIVRLSYSSGGGGAVQIRRARAQEDAGSSFTLSVKLLDADANVTGDALEVHEITGYYCFGQLNPLLYTGDDLLVAQVDSVNLTPSQAVAPGDVVRATITGTAGAYSWIEAQLDDGTNIILYNVNGQPWQDLLPSLKNVTGRDKCFAIVIGSTYYAIPDFANIGKA